LALRCVFVTLIVVVSFLPLTDKHALHTTGRFHPLGHLLTFAAIGFVAVMTPKSFRVRILFILGALVLGFGIEFCEHLIFQGAVEWRDVLMDGIGVFGGILLALVSRPRGRFLWAVLEANCY